MSHANVLYVEPNYTNAYVDGNMYEMPPKIEDYCIVVDLEVEVTERSNGSYGTSDSRTILFSWTSTNGSVSFNSGEDFSNIKVTKSINYLTTAPYEIGTYSDMMNYGTHECFGINSIDISYNNYAVPEVTIQFTDIRGISLFGQEELRHSGVNSEGASGFAKQDIAGSFFKCFFTFPYPKFKLMVKGFYGEPTAYELCCSDFRASFDCNTGNFGATAKFIGYAYSLLNDITMNALVAVPYCDYVGKDYWDSMTKTDFVVNGVQMPTFIDIITKIKNIKEDTERLSKDSELSVKLKKYDDEGKYISNIINTFDEYYETLVRNLYELNINGDDMNPLENKDNRSFILFDVSDDLNNNGKDKFDFISLNTKYSTFETALKEYNRNFGANIIAPSKFDSFNLIDLSNPLLQETIKKNEFYNTYEITIEGKGYKYAQYYDNTKFMKLINDIHEKNKNNIEETNKMLSLLNDELINRHLGFEPTVENITSILMAHLDTLIHCIYCCSNEVKSKDNERIASKLGMLTSDVKFNNSIVPPFPRIDTSVTHNGVTTIEEGWIGDLIGGANQPEVNLVEGLLRATNNIADIINKCATELKKVDGYEDSSLDIDIPLSPLDIVANVKPFGTDINFSDPSDFIGKLGLRMFNLFGSNDVCKDYELMGKADAVNFARTFPRPNDRFLALLNNGLFTPNVIYDSLLNIINSDTEGMKLDGRWAWDIHTNKESVNLMKPIKNNGGYELNLYGVGNEQLLPVRNLNFKTINEEYNLEVVPNNNDYVSNIDVSKNYSKDDDLLFKIDKEYTKYESYMASMKFGGKTFDYINSLGLSTELDDYFSKYYENDSVRFGYCFLKSGDNVNLEGIENNWLLPPYYPTYEEVINSTAFVKGRGYDDLKIIRQYINGGLMARQRKRASFSDCINEINFMESFTYPSFVGIKNGKATNDFSLFGQKEYYQQKSLEAQALLFLETLKYTNNTFSDDGGLMFYKVVNEILKENIHFSTLPYCCVLLIGAYIYRYENGELITFGGNLPNRNIDETIIPTDYLTKSDFLKLFNLRKSIKSIFINEFKSWVNSEFKVFKETFELKSMQGMTQLELINYLTDTMSACDYKFDSLPLYNDEYENFEHFLWKNLNHNFYENYISIKFNKKSIKLYNRETSNVMKRFMVFLVKPCKVVKPTKFIFEQSLSNRNKTFRINLSGKEYLNSFIKELQNQYKILNSSSNGNDVIPMNTDKNIKICLYKYLKALWDKWLSGEDESYWSYNSFYKKNWYFIDSFYNRIGQKAKMNIIDFSDDIMYSQNEFSYSLLSFIQKAYARNKFGLYTVQNFLDMCNNETAKNNMEKLFKPIPYNEINYPELKKHPSFIILYTYEYSSRLNINNSIYHNDSYDIGTDNYEMLPKPITTKTNLTGYKIPAFGVSYGKQYQSYFKDVNVSMDSPMVTEHALKAQFEIANIHGKKGENGKNVTVLGQDLYTIYANNSYTCTVKMMGCAWIQPLMCFNLLNIPLFRGTYLIQKVFHTIRPGVMETTFVGTRMSSTSQHFVEKCLHSKPNDEVAPIEPRQTFENQIADITNDCEYKFFNPIINGEPPLSDEDLNLSLESYRQKYNLGEFDDVVKGYENDKLINFIAGCVQKEANNQNQLGIDMVTTVIFNRFMHFGKDITQVFKDKNHEIGSTEEVKFVNSVRKIFTNYPVDLIGERTSINKQIPIYNKNEYIGLSESKELTEYDVKAMDGYCTTPGYDINDKTTKPSENKNGWWRTKGEYIAQHDTSLKSPGHVFVGGFQEYGKEHWKVKPMPNTNSNANPSPNAEGLFNAIKQTITSSRVLNISNLKLEKTKTSDYDTFYVTCSPLSGLSVVFDIVLNTYYDFITELGWLVHNDAKETPYKLKIVAKQDSKKGKKIVIGTLNGNENINVLNQYENLNENFYRALKKKYGFTISNLNEVEFKGDCKNFTTLFESRPKDWQTVVNKLFGNNEVSSCGDHINQIITNGYTWDGSKHRANDNKPSGRISDYNSNNVINHLIANAQPTSVSGCAQYVREAMQEGSQSANDIINASRPLSACVYSKFLPTWGFREIFSGFGNNTESYKPNIGDVAVIAGTTDRPHGHIHIYCGDGWYSDYKSSRINCYSDENRPFKVYRYEA